MMGSVSGINYTKQALVNLINDAESPLTKSLDVLGPIDDEFVQIRGSDSDGVFTLMDNNVTRG